jgi:hypothetical protein
VHVPCGPAVTRFLVLLLAALALSTGGCAGKGPKAVAQAPGPTGTTRPATCAAVVVRTLRGVAARIYAQAAGARNVVAAQRRLARSARLADAVGRGDAAATRAALRPLLRDPIHRIVVWRGAHRLASLGRSRALAPVPGVIDDRAGRPVGRYELSVAGDAAIAGIIRSTTGAAVTIAPHATGDATFAVAAEAFPQGPLAISLAVPVAARATCGATATATVAATDLAIARRLYATEVRGPAVRRVLRHVAGDRRFARAVASDDAAALRAAIVRFFRTRSLHVVRIRATDVRGRLVNDVGGPYVLAPASAPVRDRRGRRVGEVTLSVQDDTGYIKLLHRFTGAAVQLRTAAGAVPGSARVLGPPADGRAAFTTRAFPSGPLRVVLGALTRAGSYTS